MIPKYSEISCLVPNLDGLKSGPVLISSGVNCGTTVCYLILPFG